MATHSELRNALLAKLGVTPQRLHQLAKKRKQQLPMSTVQAYYTIAHDEGIDVSRYLSPEETAEVRQLVAQLKSAGAPALPSNGVARRARREVARRETFITIAGVNVENLPGLSPTHAAEAKAMAEKVYPMLYVFENSVRDLIERVLSAAHGADWWAKGVPPKVQQRAAKHRTDEAKDPWHGRRGARDIDYVLVSDLWLIMKDEWRMFAPLFPGPAWVESLLTNDMNVSRRPIAHMNPLATEDVKNLEAAFRKWARQLKAVAGKIP